MPRIADRALLLGIFTSLILRGSLQSESVISVRSTTATNMFSAATSSPLELIATPLIPTPTSTVRQVSSSPVDSTYMHYPYYSSVGNLQY